MENTSGIYQWRNLKDNKSYIGSAIRILSRKACHLSMLYENNHHSIHFQRAWNRDGEESFIHEILEYVPRLENESDLDFERRLCKEYEQSYLDKYGAQEFIRKESNRFLEDTYNISPTAGSSLGRKFADDYVTWNKNKKLTKKHKENLKKGWTKRKKNHPTKDSTREKMSKSISEARSRPEVIANYKAAYANRPLLQCPHCPKTSYDPRNMHQHHLDRCKYNPNLSEENKAKAEAHRAKLREAKKYLKIVTCPHCGYSNNNMGNMKMNHFDNCFQVTGVKRRTKRYKQH